MTVTLQHRPTVAPAELRTSRGAVMPAAEQDQTAVPSSDGITDHIDGDLVQARALARKFPDSQTALAGLAVCEFGFGNRVSARQAAENALALDAFEPTAAQVAANVLWMLGEVDAADRAARLMLDAPDVDDASRQAVASFAAQVAAHKGDAQEALRLLDETDDPVGQTLRGALLIAEGRYELAIGVLRKALNRMPDSPEALCNIGYAYAAMGSTRKAKQATLAAATINPVDRTAGLNLAFLCLPDDPARALEVIERLIAYHPDDLRLERAAAAAIYLGGDLDKASRRLRRLRGTTRLKEASAVDREEVKLDSLMLSEGSISPAHLFSEAEQALRRCDYRSAHIGHLLAATSTSKNLAALNRTYEELSARHDRADLLPVEYRIAMYQRHFGRCLDIAEEWVRREPFSTEAHTEASYMLAAYAGRYGDAAKVGLDATRRGIRDYTVDNNTAFSLAMEGKLDAATRVLPDSDEFALALATSGLITMLRGNIEAGIELYDECARRIRRDGDTDTAKLVDLYRLLAEAKCGLILPDDERIAGLDGRFKHIGPRFAISVHAITREAENLLGQPST